MPTAALAVIALKTAWVDLDQGNGKLVSLILPRTLPR
jgi:hypothetical protein